MDGSSVALITWKMTTAKSAPTGSSTLLSQSRIPFTRALGRANCRIGVTTVGPDTTTIAPSMTAICILRLKM